MNDRSSRRRTVVLLCALVAVLANGCATSFSPERIRSEIRAQHGEDPLSALELDFGRFTTLMIKSALAGADGELPFAGLHSLQLAVYEVAASTGPALDVTRIPVTGWEQVVRAHDPKRSALVLLRPRGDRVGDLVVIGAGPQKIVYGRLRGSLSPELPGAMSEVLRQGGPDEVQRVLSRLGDT